MAQEPTFLDDQIATGNLPKWLAKPRCRPSLPTILVELSFRAFPEEAKTGGFVYRGRAEITVTSYALRGEETRLFLLVVEQMEFMIMKMLRALGVNSDDDIESILAAIQELAKTKEPESGKPNAASDVNPFAVLWALVTGLRKDSGEPEREGADGRSVILRADSPPEAILRSHAILFAGEKCRQVSDGLKTACGAAVGAS